MKRFLLRLRKQFAFSFLFYIFIAADFQVIMKDFEQWHSPCFSCNKIKIKCKCLTDGTEWYAQPNHLLEGHGCPQCSAKKLAISKRNTHDKFIQTLKLKNSNILVLGQYVDAKTKITVWKSETEKLFEGKVYQLYDKTDFNNMYISYLRFDCMAGINVIITKEWK